MVDDLQQTRAVFVVVLLAAARRKVRRRFKAQQSQY